MKAKLESKTDSKLPSGASSKGTNTPSGRPKHSDPLKKAKGIKRPGSPNLSESSGNESTRKKHKKKHHSSSAPTGTSTPIPESRQLSPVPLSQPVLGQSTRKSSIIKFHVNSTKLNDISSAPPNPSPTGGSMSDGEATGGEMSDGGKKKKIKLRIGGASPGGSRAGSPVPGIAGSVGTSSRAGSPQAQGMPFTCIVSPSPSYNLPYLLNQIYTTIFLATNMSLATEPTREQSPGVGAIQPIEIKTAIPPGGISIHGLLKVFSSRIGDPKENKMEKKAFIAMVKENLKYNAEKLLIPK